MDSPRLKPGERNTRKLLAALSNIVARGIHIGHFFRGMGAHHGFARSHRSAAQIVGEVRAFYARRPRPWRWHGNNAKRRSRLRAKGQFRKAVR